jgi:hypothetical protein
MHMCCASLFWVFTIMLYTSLITYIKHYHDFIIESVSIHIDQSTDIIITRLLHACALWQSVSIVRVRVLWTFATPYHWNRCKIRYYHLTNKQYTYCFWAMFKDFFLYIFFFPFYIIYLTHTHSYHIHSEESVNHKAQITNLKELPIFLNSWWPYYYFLQLDILYFYTILHLTEVW